MSAAPYPGAKGPGRLILIVGPSGAGKDTLIDGARDACRGDARIVFPRRVVTRPGSDAEDNETMDAPQFERAASAGAFALWWRAHGHHYGIPRSSDAAIEAGRVVVCNVSRTIVGEARLRYADVTVVLVTAPPDVLQARLAGRARYSDGNIGSRLQRSADIAVQDGADVVIENVGEPAAGIRSLLDVIQADLT